jgi:hypothetical protein
LNDLVAAVSVDVADQPRDRLRPLAEIVAAAEGRQAAGGVSAVHVDAERAAVRPQLNDFVFAVAVDVARQPLHGVRALPHVGRQPGVGEHAVAQHRPLEQKFDAAGKKALAGVKDRERCKALHQRGTDGHWTLSLSGEG